MTFATVLFVIICILLIGLVMLQQSASGLGTLGGASDSILGPAKGDFLSRATGFLALLFFVGSFFLSIISSGSQSIIDQSAQQPTPTAEAVPAVENLDSSELLDAVESETESSSVPAVPASPPSPVPADIPSASDPLPAGK